MKNKHFIKTSAIVGVSLIKPEKYEHLWYCSESWGKKVWWRFLGIIPILTYYKWHAGFWYDKQRSGSGKINTQAELDGILKNRNLYIMEMIDHIAGSEVYFDAWKKCQILVELSDRSVVRFYQDEDSDYPELYNYIKQQVDSKVETLDVNKIMKKFNCTSNFIV